MLDKILDVLIRLKPNTTVQLVSFPPVCYYYGAVEEALIEDDDTRKLKLEYAVVRPLCFLCKSEGKTHVVKMPTNVKKRPRLK